MPNRVRERTLRAALGSSEVLRLERRTKQGMSTPNLERARPAILLAFVTSFAGCSCEGDPLQVVKTPDAGFQDASPFDDAAELPDTGPEIDDAGECIATGVVTGRVCSPSARDWVAGAVVT